MSWDTWRADLAATLAALEVTDEGGAPLAADEGFARVMARVQALREARRRVYFVGNGASASMASHFSADMAKTAGVPTEVFTDPALITATGNDMGYEAAFSWPLGQRMVAGEVLIAVSSSGNSPNAVNAVRTARELGGYAVTFTAMGADNAMRRLGHMNFYVPATTYGMAESAHACLLHHLIDSFTPREAC